jgi:hypothetical protein
VSIVLGLGSVWMGPENFALNRVGTTNPPVPNESL